MGKVVYVVGDDISTDHIYPGRYMATVLPTETPQYAFADERAFNEKLNRKEIPEGSFLVAGNNFGCGSSREQAASCLRGHGLIVLAKGIARIFLQNAVNLGLQTCVVPDLEAAEGDEIELQGDRVVNKTSGKSFAMIPHAPARQAIIEAGGLIPYARRKLLEQAKK